MIVFSTTWSDVSTYSVMLVGTEPSAGNSASTTFQIIMKATNTGPPYFTSKLPKEIDITLPDTYSYSFPSIKDDDGDNYVMKVELGETSTFA